MFRRPAVYIPEEHEDLPPAYQYHWSILDSDADATLASGKRYEGRTRLLYMGLLVDAAACACLVMQSIGGWLQGTQQLGWWLLQLENGAYGSWGLWGWCLMTELTSPPSSLTLTTAPVLASRCDLWNSGGDPPDVFFVYSAVSSNYLIATASLGVVALGMCLLSAFFTVFLGYKGGGIALTASLVALCSQIVCLGMAVSLFVDLGYGESSTLLNSAAIATTTWAGWGGGLGAGISSCLLLLSSFLTKTVGFRRSTKAHLG
jgi:hypothetical protein